MISVTLVDVETYEVVVEGETETSHRVHMSAQYHRKLCSGTMTQEWVIVQSFKFLLEREPNTAILASFDLPEIGRYFPEFETEMASRLDGLIRGNERQIADAIRSLRDAGLELQAMLEELKANPGRILADPPPRRTPGGGS